MLTMGKTLDNWRWYLNACLILSYMKWMNKNAAWEATPQHGHTIIDNSANRYTGTSYNTVNCNYVKHAQSFCVKSFLIPMPFTFFFGLSLRYMHKISSSHIKIGGKNFGSWKSVNSAELTPELLQKISFFLVLKALSNTFPILCVISFFSMSFFCTKFHHTTTQTFHIVP